jgi:hypothetical protein
MALLWYARGFTGTVFRLSCRSEPNIPFGHAPCAKERIRSGRWVADHRMGLLTASGVADVAGLAMLCLQNKQCLYRRHYLVQDSVMHSMLGRWRYARATGLVCRLCSWLL